MKRALLPLIASAAMCGSSASAAETIAPSEPSQATNVSAAQDETELDVVLSQTAFELGNGSNPTVPEPTTWIMLILGLLAVGFAMRRPASDSTVRVRYF